MQELNQSIVQFQQDQLMPFCIDFCEKNCCNQNHDSLSEDQVRLIFQVPKSQPLSTILNRLGTPALIQKWDGDYTTDLTRFEACPAQDKVSRLCNIHKHPLRPYYCHSFPFYLTRDSLTITKSKCEGLRKLDFNHIIEKARKKNFPTRIL